MTGDGSRNWYRRSTWTAADERDFRERLAQARKKSRPQYLKLQALYLLGNGLPAPALGLLDEFFANPDEFHAAEARTLRERALAELSAISAATSQTMQVAIEDPALPDIRALLEEHLRDMHEISPRESVHALDVSGLQKPEITFWSVRDGATLIGCGALKEIDSTHGEIKSMRTPRALRRRGAGRAVLAHIISVARARGYKRLSLETGSMAAFAPAQRLYASAGFEYCEPFGEYRPDPNSVFMTLKL